MASKSVFEDLNKEFILPFQPYPFQEAALNEAVSYDSLLLPLQVGRGKTAMATWLGLWHSLHNGIKRLLFLVPAPIVVQWGDWLKSIRFIDGVGLDVVVYEGSVAKRKTLNFDHDCIVMSHQIFLKDFFKKIAPAMSRDPNVFVVYDESQDGLRKSENKIWQFFLQFTLNKRILLLSGTPVTTPMDTFAIVKLLSPEIYPNKKQFISAHVGAVDKFGRVTDWLNLELMQRALYNKAVLVKAEDMSQLPDVVIDAVNYQLAPKHLRHYKELGKTKYLQDDSGDKIPIKTISRMFHTLQRLVTIPSALNLKKIQTNLLKLIWTVYKEDTGKLIVFANYRDTNEMILNFFAKEKVPAVGYWGAFTNAQKQAAKDAFISDDKVRVMVGHPRSLGVGTDGLQYVCYRELFAELPLTPTHFEQAIGRIDRTGQQEHCIVKCLIAKATIQQNLYRSLLKKDDLLNRLVQGKISLRSLFS